MMDEMKAEDRAKIEDWVKEAGLWMDAVEADIEKCPKPELREQLRRELGPQFAAFKKQREIALATLRAEPAQ